MTFHMTIYLFSNREEQYDCVDWVFAIRCAADADTLCLLF